MTSLPKRVDWAVRIFATATLSATLACGSEEGAGLGGAVGEPAGHVEADALADGGVGAEGGHVEARAADTWSVVADIDESHADGRVGPDGEPDTQRLYEDARDPRSAIDGATLDDGRRAGDTERPDAHDVEEVDDAFDVTPPPDVEPVVDQDATDPFPTPHPGWFEAACEEMDGQAPPPLDDCFGDEFPWDYGVHDSSIWFEVQTDLGKIALDKAAVQVASHCSSAGSSMGHVLASDCGVTPAGEGGWMFGGGFLSYQKVPVLPKSVEAIQAFMNVSQWDTVPGADGATCIPLQALNPNQFGHDPGDPKIPRFARFGFNLREHLPPSVHVWCPDGSKMTKFFEAVVGAARVEWFLHDLEPHTAAFGPAAVGCVRTSYRIQAWRTRDSPDSEWELVTNPEPWMPTKVEVRARSFNIPFFDCRCTSNPDGVCSIANALSPDHHPCDECAESFAGHTPSGILPP